MQRQSKSHSGSLTKRASKQVEALAYAAKVQTALTEAHIAAAKAANKFVKAVDKDTHGLVIDACGGASVLVSKPSHHFRTALKMLREIDDVPWRRGWQISDFWSKDIPPSAWQSVSTAEIACQAACDVLKRHFPDEDIFITSRVD